MTAHILALTHGALGLKFACAIFLVPMFAALIDKRTPWRHYFLWPLVAVPMLLVVFLIFMLLFRWLPGADSAVVGILRIVVVLVLFPWFGYHCGKALVAGDLPAATIHRRGAI